MLSLRAMFFFGSSMRRGFTFFRSFLFCATLATAASAQPAPDPGAAEKQFAQMMASEHGLDAAAVLETLHRAQYRQSVIDTMTRPAEAKPWKDYRPIFVTQRRIDDGAAFLEAHRTLLDRTGKQYGLPPQMIAAIIGVESNYGRTPMRYRVLDALVAGLDWMSGAGDGEHVVERHRDVGDDDLHRGLGESLGRRARRDRRPSSTSTAP